MDTAKTIFVVEDDAVTQALLDRWLGVAGFGAKGFGRAEEALYALETLKPDALLLDLGLPGLGGMDALRRIRAAFPDLPVIIVTARSELEIVVEAMREGAEDYLVKPFDADRVLAALKRALSHGSSGPRKARRVPGPGEAGRPIIGQGAAVRELLAQVQRVAGADVPVHISGESGSGKELVARAVHAASARAAGPFLAVNCGAISETLQDSELFGHEKGSFTGAIGRHRGFFEQADGGTLFLDEVAELSPSTQSRLLRVLEEGRVSRLGGEGAVPVDVRLISASNKDLGEEQAQGRFREDLFYRLVVYPIRVPPLRERPEDIPALVVHFVSQAGAGDGAGAGAGAGAGGSEALGLCRAPITEEALERLIAHPWPGNVRELENTVRFALVNAHGGVIDVEHLPYRLLGGGAARPVGRFGGFHAGGVAGFRRRAAGFRRRAADSAP